MASKEFTYRGKSLDEIKKLDTREFAKLVKSRTRRAILRQHTKIDSFVSKCEALSPAKKPIRTHIRDLVIVPKMLGYIVNIYNGKQFLPIEIVPEMLGHRLGEFSITRQKVKHGTAGIGATKSSMAKATKKT
jgi:small subunit ribosomal protein S19